MRRFVQGLDRGQSTLFPECLEDWIGEDNPVRVIDVFVDELDLAELGFSGVDPEMTGRPSYHPSALLKLYIYGYLNRVQSSRRLERDAGRNVEVMWLTGRLFPDHKTIADFRKDNGPAIRKVCARLVELCREMGLLTKASVAIDGSKFKAVNNRDRNFTRAKVERRRAQLEESVARYLSQLDTADRQEPSETLALKTTRLKEKLAKLESEMERLAALEKQMLASPDQQISLTDPDSRSMATSGRGSGVVGYNVQVAVDTENHLIVTHEVTNVGSDRAQLANVAKQAKAVLQVEKLEAVAGFISGSPRYNYGKTSWNIPRQYIEKRESLRAVAAQFGADLRTAALQFSAAPDVAAVLIVGAHTEAQVLANVSSMQAAVPPEFWAELKRQNLIDQNAPTPTVA